jgi:hypothetical protein
MAWQQHCCGVAARMLSHDFVCTIKERIIQKLIYFSWRLKNINRLNKKSHFRGGFAGWIE